MPNGSKRKGNKDPPDGGVGQRANCGDGSEAKRHKPTFNDMADEFVCPITMELPMDPVTAEDGRIYERSAIEELIERRRGQVLRSPVTNKPMGPKVLPAVQVRNMIEQLVKSGEIDEGIAWRWKGRIKGEKRVAQLKEKADGGDAEAMTLLGNIYFVGRYGLKKNRTIAYQWYRKAADQFYPRGMACAGGCLVKGDGVEMNKAEGIALVSMAVYKDGGSEMAAACLGLWHYNGKHGMPKNNKRAKYFFRMALDGSRAHKDLSHVDADIVRKRLEELTRGESES